MARRLFFSITLILLAITGHLELRFGLPAVKLVSATALFNERAPSNPRNDVNPMCLEPMDIGSCIDMNRGYDRYFYVPEQETCELFVWSGCEGNNNRFFTFDQCISFCYFNSTRDQLVTPSPHPMIGGQFPLPTEPKYKAEPEPESESEPEPEFEPDRTDENNIDNNESYGSEKDKDEAAVAAMPVVSPSVDLATYPFNYEAVAGNCIGLIISTTVQRNLKECGYDCDTSETHCFGFLFHDGFESGYSVCQLTGKCAMTNRRIEDGTFYRRRDQR